MTVADVVIMMKAAALQPLANQPSRRLQSWRVRVVCSDYTFRAGSRSIE